MTIEIRLHNKDVPDHLREYFRSASAPCGGCYVCNMRTWAREMWRVLRDDGVMFLNLGDSYAGSGKGPTGHNGLGNQERRQGFHTPGANVPPGLKPKDLCGIPWRVALALQADGWYLRSDIIWAKPNPMPESVTDRPTKAHEYVFLLTKSARYYWDAEAVREELSPATIDRDKSPRGRKQNGGGSWESLTGIEYTPELGNMQSNPAGRNIRTVWTIATASYKGAHFAVWPPALVERMIKAGSKPGDVVLDPFVGSGTTIMVARQLGRIGLGFDLSETYLYDSCRTRLGHDKLAAWGNGIKDNGVYEDYGLFAIGSAT